MRAREFPSSPRAPPPGARPQRGLLRGERPRRFHRERSARRGSRPSLPGPAARHPRGLLPRPAVGFLLEGGARGRGPPPEKFGTRPPGGPAGPPPRLGVRLERARDRGATAAASNARRRTLVATRIFSPLRCFSAVFRFLVDLDASASGGSVERAQLYRDGARSVAPRRRPRPRREHPDPRARRSRSRRRHRGGVLLRGGVPAPRRRDMRGKTRSGASAQRASAARTSRRSRRADVASDSAGRILGDPDAPSTLASALASSRPSRNARKRRSTRLRLVRGEASRVEADGVRGQHVSSRVGR